MAKHVLLNNVEHAGLRVVTTRSADLGDDVMYAVTFPWEFRNLQAHYPILFRKRPDTGEFQPIALFGFEERENLFLSASGWDAAYVPLTIERQPFLIGMQPAGVGGASEPQPVIHVDLDSPRISQDERRAGVSRSRRHQRLPRAHHLGAAHDPSRPGSNACVHRVAARMRFARIFRARRPAAGRLGTPACRASTR